MSAGHGARTEAYLGELRAEFPQFQIIAKRGSSLSRVIDAALRILTLGGQSAYLTRYVTTLGQRVYVPDDWDQRTDEERYIVLRHEAVHLRQFRRFTWPLMAFLYLVPIMPMGLALGRALLEWEAYAETLRAVAEVHGPAAAKRPELHAHIRLQFVGPAYGFMWPFRGSVQRRIDGLVRDL